MGFEKLLSWVRRIKIVLPNSLHAIFSFNFDFVANLVFFYLSKVSIEYLIFEDFVDGEDNLDILMCVGFA